MAKVIVEAQIDEQVLAKAAEVLSRRGLSVSQANELFLERVVAEDAWPLELVPNAETRAAMEETEEIIRSGRPGFSTAEELFEHLEKEIREAREASIPGYVHKNIF